MPSLQSLNTSGATTSLYKHGPFLNILNLWKSQVDLRLVSSAAQRILGWHTSTVFLQHDI